MSTKKPLTLLSLAVLITTLMQGAYADFIDVDTHHVDYLAIQYLEASGVVGGYADGTYKPRSKLNKAEALKIILAGSEIEVDAFSGDTGFSDVQQGDWFTDYVLTAKSLGIVQGNPDGTFLPARTVTRAEFLKMLLEAREFNRDEWVGKGGQFKDVDRTQWFAPYLAFAEEAGLLVANEENKLLPAEQITRADAARLMYGLAIYEAKDDIQFLMEQAELQMVQIDRYAEVKDLGSAKQASETAMRMTAQALEILPDNSQVLSAAKIAQAYDYLMVGYLAALAENPDSAQKFCEKAILTASEATKVNSSIRLVAEHIQRNARKVLSQL